MRRPESEFLTAITSINVTFYLLAFLRIAENLRTRGKRKIITANRRQLKAFCRLNAASKSAFYELNSLALIEVFEEWLRVKQKISIMEF